MRHQLHIKQLSLSFGGLQALANVNMEIHKGELVAVIGPNGAGKTSLVNCIGGFYRPQRGQIQFEGQDITRLPTHAIAARGVARAFQNVELFRGMTVLENLTLARHLQLNYGLIASLLYFGRARAEEAGNRAIVEQVLDFMELEPYRYKTVGTLAYGVQKRVEMARALCLQPSLLILDEPMAGMTVAEKEDMARFILDVNEEQGTTVILIEHDLGVVMDLSSKVYVLNFGRVIAGGTPADVAADPEVISAYMGTDETQPVASGVAATVARPEGGADDTAIQGGGPR